MRTAIVVLATLAVCGSLAHADMAAAVDPCAVTWTNQPNELAVGWRFFADQAFTITHLGLYDDRDNGLRAAHTLGLWRVNKEGGLTLMRQAQIGPGTGTLIDHHRFVDIEDFTILPDPEPWINPVTRLPYINPTDGKPYYERWVVGAWSKENAVDPVILQPRDAATILAESAGFLHIQNQLKSESGGFTCPWGIVSNYDHFGVNFLYTPGVVPAPGAVLLGVIGLAYAGRRLRRERP